MDLKNLPMCAFRDLEVLDVDLVADIMPPLQLSRTHGTIER